MNRDTLHNIFKSPYQSDEWKTFLKELFRDISASYFETPINLKDDSLVKHKDVEHIWEYGDITLSDGRVIKFYEVELKENQQVTKNRVGLRNIVSGEIGFGYIDGAIITYYNKNASDWRFTFISKSLYWDEDNNEVKTETHAKRYTYLLGQNETVKTALNQFEWLFKQIKTRGIKLEDILKAFSVEKLSKEFYDGYFHQYETFVSYIVDNPNAFNHFLNQISASNTLEDKHKKAEHLVSDFVKKFLGRIVFLFFLQKKGWMGVSIDKEWGEGQLDFLFRLFKEFPDKNNFYENALAPLFFRTLNVDRSENNDIFSVTNTRIPYLNGGLFEKDETEPENIQFKPKRFEDLFAFFNQYNFTVDESSPDDQDIGVDPEMLGHIFENLLEDNKDKGAFYTPKEIVHYMTQESLIEYLNTHLDNTSKEDLSVFVKQKKQGKLSENELEEINSSLNKLKILDPAIGSGAFPMGLLHEIFALKGLIAFEQGYEAWSPARVKERIIENSIYGVDIEKGAVDIAQLRFWLSLVVDEPTPRPLPNLDYKIICGNSLISRYSLDTPINEVFREFNLGRAKEDKVDLAKYKALVNDYMHEANQEKKEEFKQLIEDVKSAFKTHFSSKKQNDIKKLKQELNNYNLPRVFKHKQTAVEKRRNTKLRKDIAKREQEKKDCEEAKIFKEAVEWRFEFPNLLDKEGDFVGFDIVIGNPPYIQLQKALPNDDKLKYADLYKTLSFETFERTGDIYALFYEKGIQTLKHKGALIYITSNKWMRANYGKSLRKYFSQNNPLLLLDLGPGVFDTATVDSNIVQVEKQQNQQEIKAITLNNKGKVSNLKETDFVNLKNLHEDAWIILSEQEQKIKDRIEEVGTPLKDWDININYGIKTGYNAAFIIDGKTKDSLIREDPKSAEIIKPMLRGRDIKRYKADFADLWLIGTFPALKLNIDDYPAIKEYLERYLPKIKQTGETFINSKGEKQKTRKKTGNKWFETQDQISYYKEFEKENISWKAVGRNLTFCLLKKQSYLTAPASFLTSNCNKYFLAILHSSIAFNRIIQNADKTGAGDVMLNIQSLERLPIPKIPESEQKPFENLVDYIIALKQHTEKEIQSQYFEYVIDTMVYELYFEQDFKQAGKEVLKHLTDLKPVEDEMEEEEKMAIIQSEFERLYHPEHPVRCAVETIDSIEEVRIIKEALR